MADGNLAIYLRKLNQVLPSEAARESLRKQLTIGDRLQCWRCGIPKEPSAFCGESIICDPCIPEFERRVLATQLVLSGGDFDEKLKELRAVSGPEFINEVDRGISRMKDLEFSMASDMIDQYHEVRGLGLSDEARENHIPDHKTAQRLSQQFMGMMAKRDDQLSTTNPFEGVDSKALLGDALQTVIDQMKVDIEFRETAIDALYQQLPDLIDMLSIASGKQMLEAPA
ncbi:MAG: hypothetical protein GY759_11580 [Chloroflexi bacterium]|nr:hypothetical protein [Chloroflexota bacterium]